MTWLWVVLVVVIVGLTAAVAAGRGGAMARAYPDRREVRLPAGRPITAADLTKVRFSVVLRGYRMDEVDEVIEHLVRELAARDVRLAALERSVESRQHGVPGDQDGAGARHPDHADRSSGRMRSYEPAHGSSWSQPVDSRSQPVAPNQPATWRVDPSRAADWTARPDQP